MRSRISLSASAAIRSGVRARAKSAGVTWLTRASVHWADKHHRDQQREGIVVRSGIVAWRRGPRKRGQPCCRAGPAPVSYTTTMAKRAKPPQRRARRKRVFRRFVLATATIGLLALGAAASVGYLVYTELDASLPPIEGVVDYKPPIATQILAHDGTIIGEFFNEKRYLVSFDRIPTHVRQAFIAAEDQSFYEHRGVDPVGITRAFINNLAAGGRKVQGGSTITQQVVKSLLLTPQKSYERKIKEIILSLRLEQQLSKEEILALYLNHIYLGSSAHGIVAAAREYFDKNPEQLNLAEAALLAGLPQAPSRYSPFRHWPRAKSRQRYVLKRMYDSGFITAEERDAALARPLALATRSGSFRAAPYFVEHVRQIIEQKYGPNVYDLGLRVHTTADVRLQETAEAALQKGLIELAKRHKQYRTSYRAMDEEERSIYRTHQDRAYRNQEIEDDRPYEAIVTAVEGDRVELDVGPHSGVLVLREGEKASDYQKDDFLLVHLAEDDDESEPRRFALDSSPPVEGALVAVDPHTGFVRAMVGGYDFERSQFNRATQAKRQPGSSFKPFVFSAALDANFTPASVILDEPLFYNDHGRVWTPQNFEKKHYGLTSLREALTHSRNVVSVKLADQIGIGYLVTYLERFRFTGPLARNLSLALGSAEVTPLELTTAYTAFANDGMISEPVFITQITDHVGEVLESYEIQTSEVIPATTAYLVTSMLQDVVQRGTGRSVRGLGQPTAGKTGTTNDLHDGWFIGFTPQMLTAVWVGFDNKRSIRETGGRVAAPIWKEFMTEALRDLPRQEFAIPEGLKCVHVDPHTGVRAGAGEGAILECFRAGSEPRPGSIPAIQLVGKQNDRRQAEMQFLLNDF
jgi:penicillin-binding protein 1A